MNIPSHDIFQLLLLKATLENEAVGTVYTAICPEFRKEVIFEMI
jgi:hypothetical protein